MRVHVKIEQRGEATIHTYSPPVPPEILSAVEKAVQWELWFEYETVPDFVFVNV